MKLLVTTLVFYFIGFVTATVNVCIPYQSVDVEDTNALLEDVNQLTAQLQNDPIPVGHVDIQNLTHPALTINGTLDNVLIYNLDDFNLCILDLSNLLSESVDLFNITFKNITIKGDYNITGDLGDLFDIFGNGPFKLELINFSIAMKNFTFTKNNSDICFQINIDLDLYPLHINLENLMGDEELGDLMNRAFTSIGPESIRIVWSEIKDIFDGPIEEAINNLLHQTNLGTVLNKLHKISLSNVSSWEMCYPSKPSATTTSTTTTTTTFDEEIPFVKVV